MKLKNGNKISNIKLQIGLQRSSEIYTLTTMNEQLQLNGLSKVNTIEDGVMQIHDSGKFVSIEDYNQGHLVLFKSKSKLRKYLKATKKIANKEQEKECGSSMFLIKYTNIHV